MDINFIIWLLTDIDLKKEWSKSSTLQKIDMIYTVIGFIFFEILFLGLILHWLNGVCEIC